jgi:hypothetical protein
MIEQILSQLPAEDLAARLGTDPATAMDAARRALPTLLGGLSNEVATGGGEALGAALRRDHDGSLLDQADPLQAVDVNDGEKILGHVFGEQQGDVVRALGGGSQGNTSIFAQLLPMLAPLVMAWLGKQLTGATAGGAGPMAGGAGPAARPATDGGLGGLLGGLLGGSSGTPGGGLGDLLGGLLGAEVAQTRSAMPDLGGLFDMVGTAGPTRSGLEGGPGR